jgi:hypothetical protein
MIRAKIHLPNAFKVEVAVSARKAEVADLIAAADFLDSAVWKFHLKISRRGLRLRVHIQSAPLEGALAWFADASRILGWRIGEVPNSPGDVYIRQT